MPKISGRAEAQEVFVLCPFQNSIGPCGMQERVDGELYQDHSDSKFGGLEECQTVVSNFGPYWILLEVHQGLCLDYCAYGEAIEEEWYILLV